MNLGNRIAECRKKKKMTQEELANKLYVSDKTVSSWEAGRTEPSLDMISKLSEILECRIVYLIYGNISKTDIETEIKIKLSEQEFKELEIFMKKNAQYLSKMNQIDTYYQPTYRKFLNDGVVNEWLRIGKRGNKTILNYKNWYAKGCCNEYEVEIDNEEHLDKILKVLGLEQIAVVDKTRFTYFYLDKYEIALDYVKSLGYFVEIEVKEYQSSILDEYENLLKIAKELNLNLDHIDERGYPYHFIFKDKEYV